MEYTKSRIDKMTIQKQFFSMIYRPILEKGGNFTQGHNIRIYQPDGEKHIVKFYNNINDLVDHVSRNNRNCHTYFTLASTDGEGGTVENQKLHTVLGLDFDRDKLPAGFGIKDLIQRFKNINIWYHALVDSGNGFHVYVCIEPTENTQRVTEVVKRIQEIVGADKDAVKPTQILRVPGTWNIKDPTEKKYVNLVYQFKQNVKPYNVDKLYNKFCTDTILDDIGNKTTEYVINTTNIPPCIEKILTAGSKEHDRYDDLCKIVVNLRKRNRSKSEIKEVCKEWIVKSGYENDKKTMDDIDNIYGSLQHKALPCKGCKHSSNCYNKVISDFNLGGNVLGLSETVMSRLKHSNRKSTKTLNGNEILIYSILTNHLDGLYREELLQELTYNGKARFSDNTLTKAVNGLEKQGLISATGKPRFYKVIPQETKIELVISMSYAAAYETIKGSISTEELRLYYYMRCLHHREQRENPKALKGNLFQINQTDIAEALGVTQGRISVMIQNLIKEKIISIHYRGKSKNHGFEYYVYRLNY